MIFGDRKEKKNQEIIILLVVGDNENMILRRIKNNSTTKRDLFNFRICFSLVTSYNKSKLSIKLLLQFWLLKERQK